MTKRTINHIATFARWILFTLGIGQLFLILLGPLIYLITNAITAFLFALYLSWLEEAQTRDSILKKIVLLSFLLLAVTFLYNYIFLLSTSDRLIIINIEGAFIFCVVGLITALFSKRHVAG